MSKKRNRDKKQAVFQTNARSPGRGVILLEVDAPNGLVGCGFVNVTWPDGDKAKYEVEPRLLRTLYFVVQASDQDAAAGVPVDASGWRSGERIAEAIDKITEWLLNKKTVGRYVGWIIREHQQAAANVGKNGDANPAPIERRRSVGYRLSPEFKVVFRNGNGPLQT
jgi:hypothetical protein